MSKEVVFDQEAREKLRTGAEKLAKAVRITLGANGNNVGIGKGLGSTDITNDGVTVARACDWKDEIENMGAYMLKEASTRTEDEAGDGTSTCIIIAYEMLVQGLKHINSGSKAMDIKRGMNKAIDCVVSELNKRRKKVSGNVDDMRNIATISANNDPEIGNLIMKAIDAVGPDGVITVDESHDTSTTVVTVEGAEIDRGYMSPYFITDMSKEIGELDNPLIIVTDHRVTSMKQLIPILDKINESEYRSNPILLIADDVDSVVLSTIVLNKTQGIINLSCIKTPGYGDSKQDLTQDIATIVGANVISRGKGMDLEEMTIGDLGYATKIILDSDKSTIIDGDGDTDEINDRINLVKSMVSKTKDEYKLGKLKERLAKLVGGVAVIYVGGYSEVEREEKRYRIDDALSATKAAIEEGIVPGGGIALINCMSALSKLKCDNDDEKLGVKIVKDACRAPFDQIMKNSDLTPEVIFSEVKKREENVGYNVRTNEYVDMIEAGVVDPVKVTKSAIKNAGSVIGMLLTTGAVIIEEK